MVEVSRSGTELPVVAPFISKVGGRLQCLSNCLCLSNVETRDKANNKNDNRDIWAI